MEFISVNKVVCLETVLLVFFCIYLIPHNNPKKVPVINTNKLLPIILPANINTDMPIGAHTIPSSSSTWIKLRAK